jgi:hypothetical protein
MGSIKTGKPEFAPLNATFQKAIVTRLCTESTGKMVAILFEFSNGFVGLFAGDVK